MLVYKRFLIFSIISIASTQHINDVFVTLITDVSTSLFPATRISCHLCNSISDDEILRLSWQFSNHRLIHTFRNNFDHLDPLIYDNLEHKNLYILDMECEYSIYALQRANASELFSSPKKWLLLGRENHWEDLVIKETFKDLGVYPDSDVLMARKMNDSEDFDLISIYRPSSVREVIIEFRGNWSASGGVRLNDRRVASIRRMNLQKTPLKSCLVMTDPDTINHLTDYQHKRTDPVTKATYTWINHMIKRMNATISFEISDSWGYKMPNGSFSGMIGMLQRKEIDIGGTATFFVAERIEIVEYVQLYTKTRSGWLFRQPLLSSNRDSKSAKYWRELNPANPSFSDDFLVILGAMAQQGYSYEPYRVPSRITTLMVLIFALSLYASYTANIVSLLQTTTDAIKTLADLLYSPLKKGAQDVIYNRHYFKTFTDNVRKALVETVEPKGKKGSWMSLDEGVRKIRNELFAFHGELGTMYQVVQETFLEDEKCGLTEIDYLNILYPLLVIQKRSPYLEIIRNGALKIKESGLQDREHFRLWTKKPECYGNTNFISIGFQECYFPLVIMGYGTLITVAVLIIEMLWRKRQYVKSRSMEVIRSPERTPSDIFD
ncbi:ionotropic receptor 75a-like isoform X2 [Prorops nasuta]|uniref:ionotropic receptor 75a-like isoform X2 n=1 Tax=Prorops nasuta TaxID=863751 RepID=UPI0034CDDE04